MSDAERRAYRWVSLGLLLFIVTHALGMLAMATLLRPGMDPASFSAAERMAYVASHPISWRLGWLPWQLSAASDLWLNVALIVWLSRRPGRGGLGLAIAALAFDVVSAVPEQWAELMLVTRFIDVAAAGHLPLFEARLALYTQITAVWAGTGYTVMTALWIALARRLAGRGAWPLSLELGMLAAFGAGVALTWQSTVADAHVAAWFLAAGIANGVAFPAITAWALYLGAVLGEVARSDGPDPADAASTLRWPSSRALRALAPLASDGARDVLRPLSRVLPYPHLISDVRDVVYVTWMVPTARVTDLLPPSLALDTYSDRTALTVLTYRHGHFGPRLLGPLRALLPSPAQSNWRLHLAPTERGAAQDRVFFFKTVIDAPSYVIGSRLLADGLPSHLPASFEHRRDGSELCTKIDPGDGSAPDLAVRVREVEAVAVPAEFEALGADLSAIARRLVPQQGAVRTHPRVGLRSSSDIVVDVDPETIRPAEVLALRSQWLAPIVRGCAPLAFVAPRVTFHSTSERWSALG